MPPAPRRPSRRPRPSPTAIAVICPTAIHVLACRARLASPAIPSAASPFPLSRARRTLTK